MSCAKIKGKREKRERERKKEDYAAKAKLNLLYAFVLSWREELTETNQIISRKAING
jgi:hypothetical protein